jgi:hypothetical protein
VGNLLTGVSAEFGGSWADEVEDSFGMLAASSLRNLVCLLKVNLLTLMLGSQPLPAAGRTGYTSYSRDSGGFGGQRNEQGVFWQSSLSHNFEPCPLT